MKKQKNKIESTYFDALYYASSEYNKKQEFFLRPVEFKLLLKLIHYSSNQKNITWTTSEISKQTSICSGSIDKSIQRLKQKGYITTTTYNTDTNTKRRTIFINWTKISDIDLLYIDSLLPIDEKEAITETISTQPIQDVVEELIVADNEDMEESMDYIQELKDILNSDYPMMSDIERKLVMIFTEFNSYEISDMTKYIYKNRKDENFNIDEYLLQQLETTI